MKSRSCDLVRRVGVANYAKPLPGPSGGQAPALHFSVGIRDANLSFGKSWGRRETVPALFSYQSLMPAGAGAGGHDLCGNPRASWA